MPNFLLSIENTESCPWNGKHGYQDSGCLYHKMKDSNLWQYCLCPGLSEQGCPACENTCENCEHQNDCAKKIANDKMSYPRYLEFCSAHKRKE